MSFWGPVAGSAIQTLGGIWTARKQMRMANTAIQRRVADLRAAGINPLYAVGQAAQVPNIQNPLASAGAAGTALGQLRLQSKSVAADVSLKGALEGKAIAETENLSTARMVMQEDINVKKTQAGLNLIRQQLESLDIPKKELDHQMNKALLNAVEALQTMNFKEMSMGDIVITLLKGLTKVKIGAGVGKIIGTRKNLGKGKTSLGRRPQKGNPYFNKERRSKYRKEDVSEDWWHSMKRAYEEGKGWKP